MPRRRSRRDLVNCVKHSETSQTTHIKSIKRRKRIIAVLLKDKDRTIISVDKGDTSIIMDTKDYKEKCGYKFYTAKKASNESINDWAARVRSLATHWEFGQELDVCLRDRFIIGFPRGPVLDRRMEENVTITLADAMKIASNKMAAQDHYGISEAGSCAPVKEEPLHVLQGIKGKSARATREISDLRAVSTDHRVANPKTKSNNSGRKPNTTGLVRNGARKRLAYKFKAVQTPLPIREKQSANVVGHVYNLQPQALSAPNRKEKFSNP
ncbi:hypothetical protein Trydic_g21221 [Trypoxylus dichotomus]